MKKLVLGVALAVASITAAHAGDSLKVLADATKTAQWGKWVEYYEGFSKIDYAFHEKSDYQYNAAKIIKAYSADQVFTDFKNNEIVAKKRYGDQPFRVQFTINQIGYDAFGKTRVAARVNRFDSIFFKDVPEDVLMNSKKGDKAELVCQGGDFAAIIPIIQNCKTTRQYLIDIPSNIPSADTLNANNIAENDQVFDYLFTFIAFRNAVGAEKFDKMSDDDMVTNWSQIALHHDSKLSKAFAEQTKHLMKSLSAEQRNEILSQGKDKK